MRIFPELASDHEEADTKLVALVKSAQVPTNNSVMVRYPSGDIDDILFLFLMHAFDDVRVFIDNGSGKSRRIVYMSSSGLSLSYRQALSGIHAFSGNDYVSSFFRKGKQLFWKKLLEYPDFVDVFSKLGVFNAVTPDMEEQLEKFVCILYGYPKLSSVNKVRIAMFMQKFQKDQKTTDLCNLPPCSANLKYHATKSNYVANIYERANRLNMCLDNHREHGWDENGNVVWSDDYFPNDVQIFFELTNQVTMSLTMMLWTIMI